MRVVVAATKTAHCDLPLHASPIELMLKVGEADASAGKTIKIGRRLTLWDLTAPEGYILALLAITVGVIGPHFHTVVRNPESRAALARRLHYQYSGFLSRLPPLGTAPAR